MVADFESAPFGLQAEVTPQKTAKQNGHSPDGGSTVPTKRKAPTSAFSSNSTLSDLSEDSADGTVDTPATAVTEDMEVDEKSPSKSVRRSARQSVTSSATPKSQGRRTQEPKPASAADRRTSTRIKKQRMSVD
jgi:hypothetical protein